MKYINTIFNYIFISIIIIFLYLFFHSIHNYINTFEEKIDNNRDLVINKINDLDALNGIGKLVKDTVVSKDYGYSGEDYSFNSDFYPYFNNLDDNEKILYKQIYANAIFLKSDFNPMIDIDKDDITIVIESVMYDHPELFYLDNKYSYKYNNEGRCLQIHLDFNNLADNYVYNKEMFEYNVSLIVEEASKYNSDLDKEKYVHDKLVSILNYDNNSSNNQSAYSAIVDKYSVCAGYSKAFQYIMQKLDIPCYYVTGYSGGDHAWNIVKIDDYYYNVDLTWDNTGSNMYNYFNKNDNDFYLTHERSNISSKLPGCIGKSYTKINMDNSYIIDFKIN